MQADIAKYYKISPALVSKLVQEAQRYPEKTAELKLKEEECTKTTEVIKSVVSGMLSKNVPIVNAKKVVEAAYAKEGMTVTVYQVKTVMKDVMGLGYRMSKKVPV